MSFFKIILAGLIVWFGLAGIAHAQFGGFLKDVAKKLEKEVKNIDNITDVLNKDDEQADKEKVRIESKKDNSSTVADKTNSEEIQTVINKPEVNSEPKQFTPSIKANTNSPMQSASMRNSNINYRFLKSNFGYNIVAENSDDAGLDYSFNLTINKNDSNRFGLIVGFPSDLMPENFRIFDAKAYIRIEGNEHLLGIFGACQFKKGVSGGKITSCGLFEEDDNDLYDKIYSVLENGQTIEITITPLFDKWFSIYPPTSAKISQITNTAAMKLVSEPGYEVSYSYNKNVGEYRVSFGSTADRADIVILKDDGGEFKMYLERDIPFYLVPANVHSNAETMRNIEVHVRVNGGEHLLGNFTRRGIYRFRSTENQDVLAKIYSNFEAGQDIELSAKNLGGEWIPIYLPDPKKLIRQSISTLSPSKEELASSLVSDIPFEILENPVYQRCNSDPTARQMFDCVEMANGVDQFKIKAVQGNNVEASIQSAEFNLNRYKTTQQAFLDRGNAKRAEEMQERIDGAERKLYELRNPETVINVDPNKIYSAMVDDGFAKNQIGAYDMVYASCQRRKNRTDLSEQEFETQCSCTADTASKAWLAKADGKYDSRYLVNFQTNASQRCRNPELFQ